MTPTRLPTTLVTNSRTRIDTALRRELIPEHEASCDRASSARMVWMRDSRAIGATR